MMTQVTHHSVRAVPICLSDAVKDTTYGTAGRRHGHQLMMVKDGNCPLLTSRSNDDDNDVC